jgi:hypothetical protein
MLFKDKAMKLLFLIFITERIIVKGNDQTILYIRLNKNFNFMQNGMIDVSFYFARCPVFGRDVVFLMGLG